MSQFVKNIFSSCLGVTLAFMVVGLLGILLIAGIAGTADQPVEVSKNTVLHLKLNNPIPEQTNNIEISPFTLKEQKILGLHDIIETIEHAAGDDNIEGILIDLSNDAGSGITTAASVRDAILEFRESGKFVIAYSKNYSQGTYFIASAADKVYLNPLGNLDFHGFSAMVPFFKEMLDNVGIKMQVFYAGDFKSATEPYRLNSMSEKNRRQLRDYLEPVYNNYLTEISRSRNKSVQELRSIADEIKIREADDAVTYGLVDQIGYIDDVIDDLKTRMELEDDDALKTIDLEEYARSFTKKRNSSTKERIALVYAEGSILTGDGEKGTIGDDAYIKVLRKIRKDEQVKAIVLRVNSPGGSALASENIWRELSLAKAAGKKIVVSMGDYAASGGYYISCMADKIIAEPNTLTGSIGVFSMLPNASELFEQKLGIHWDSVKTTSYSTGLNPFFDLAPEEKEYLQEATDKMYEKFLKRVAEGRNMSRDSVHQIAQGRIWVGTRAVEIGLVDETGSLDDALATAAAMAGLEKYRLMEYPYQKDPLTELIEELTGQDDEDAIRQKILQKELGSFYNSYRQAKEIITTEGVQARLPFILDFK